MKSKRRGKISGAVLIMVLTVMFVLIIMLMATLTVVTTAGKRIYTKYEENQAYYTARSALDVFAGNMLNDSTYNYSTSPTGGNVTQGCKIQEQLYTVIVHNGATEANPQGNGSPAPTSAKKNENIYGNVDKNYLEYEVALPTLANSAESGAENYGNFSDDDGITIRVEVVDRSYDAGNDGVIGNGDDLRKKDSMKIKVTSTATVMGVESTAAAIFGSKKPAANTAERAVTVTGGGNMQFNNTSILGGLAAPVNATLGNDPCIWGNIFIGDGFNSAVSLHAVATDNEWLYLRGKDNGGTRDPLTLNNGTDIKGESTGASTMPNLLIDSSVTFGSSSFTFGGSGKEIKMIVNGDLNGSNGIEIFGDIFVIGTLNPNDRFTVHGDVYIIGTGDFTLAQNGVTIDGDIYASGTVLTRMEGSPSHIANNFSVGGLSGASSVAKIHYSPSPFPVTITGLKTAGKSDADVAAELAANNNYIMVNWNGTDFKISSEGEMYGQFYRYADMNEGTITASEYAFLSEDDLEKLMDSSANFEYPADFKRIHEYIDDSVTAGLVQPVLVVSGGSISSPGKYSMSPSTTSLNGGTFTIDAGGPVEIFIDPGYYCSNGGRIVVKSGTTVKFFGKPGNYTFQMEIVTEEFMNGGSLYVGEYGSDGTANTLMSIPISYYFEGESTVSFGDQIGGIGPMLIGHVYIPRGRINNSGAAGKDVSSRLVYNKVDFMTNGGRSSRFAILGSVICNGYQCSNSQTGGVAFVKAEDVVIPTGVPQLTFEPVGYTRR